MNLLTIGHSNHSPGDFLQLLVSHRVEVIADVRSWPHSRHAPWSDLGRLPVLLRDAGIQYVHLGQQLGGRPEDPEAYNAAGHVLYGHVATSDPFRAGLERLKQGLDRYRVAAMCAEENPEHCHRRLLIAKVLVDEGVAVSHIRGDGRIEQERGIRAPDGMLFADEDDWWTSTQSVLRKQRQPTSSVG